MKSSNKIANKKSLTQEVIETRRLLNSKPSITLSEEEAIYRDLLAKVEKNTDQISSLSLKDLAIILNILNKFAPKSTIAIIVDKKLLLTLLETFIRKVNHIDLINQNDHVKSFVDFVVRQQLLSKSWPELYFAKSINFTPKIITNNFALLARAIMQTGTNYQKPIRKFYKEAIKAVKASDANFQPIDLINILESMTKVIGINDAQSRELISEFILFTIKEIQTSTITNHDKIQIIWLLGKFKYQDNSFIGFLVNQEFIAQLYLSSADELCKLMSGLDKAGYLDDSLFDSLISTIQAKITSFSPSSLVNIVQALAHIYVNNDLSQSSNSYLLLRQLSIKIASINPSKFSEAMTQQTLQLYYSLDAIDQTNLLPLKEYFPSWEAKLKTRITESKFQNTLYDLLTTKYSLEPEFWISQIASYVDAYEIERAVVFQIDGPTHHYINNNEYNSATSFNTKMIQRHEMHIIRIDAKQVTDLAKDLVEIDDSALTLAQIASKPVVQEAVLAYVESLLPYKAIAQDESKTPEGFQLSPSDQFSLGSLTGQHLIPPLFDYVKDSIDGTHKEKALVDYYSHIPESIASSSLNSLIYQGVQQLFPQLSLSNQLLATNIFSTVLRGNPKDLLSPAYYQALCKYQFKTFATFTLTVKYTHSDYYGRNSFADGVVISSISTILDLAQIFVKSVYTKLTHSETDEESSELDYYSETDENNHGQINIMPGMVEKFTELEL